MISALGSVGTNAVRNSSSPRTVSVTLGSSVPVGNWLVAYFVTQTAWDIGRPTDSYNWAVAWDDKLNPWQMIGAGQHSDITQDGVMLHMYVCEVQRALAPGDVISAGIGNHFPGFTWVRAMTIEEFSVGAGMMLASSGAGKTGSSDGSPSDPGGLSFGYPDPTDREVLFLHALGYRGPSTDSFTWDSDYTQFATAGTNTGTPTDDRTVKGGYRIDTLSGNSDTVDVTNTTAARSWVQLMNAMVEVPKPDDFPITPILDDFNRADENPLDNGTWDATGRSSFGSTRLQIVSMEARAGGSFWDTFMEGCVEVYGTISDFGRNAIHYHADGNVQAGNMEGRGAQWRDPHFVPLEEYSLNFGFANIFGEIFVNLGDGTPIISWCAGRIYPTPPPDGSKLGIRFDKVTPTLYISYLMVDLLDGDNWRCVGAMGFNATLGSPFDNGYLSIGTNDGWDDFGGGEIECPRGGRTQIYRIIKARSTLAEVPSS